MKTIAYLWACGGLMVSVSDSAAIGRGSIPTFAVLCPGARYIYSPKILVIPRKCIPT